VSLCLLAAILFIILHDSCSIAAAGSTVVHKKTIDYLSKTYDYTDSWCPGAVCHDSDVCHPCQRRFLIVIATGRSASTTLTHMLGSLPGIRMSGENYNMLGLIRNLFDTIHKHVHPDVAMKDAWAHNPVPKGAFACAAQHMMETINPTLFQENSTLLTKDDSQTIIGFKTIRFAARVDHASNDVQETDEELAEVMVEFTKDTLPCARIIVDIRSDTVLQAESMKEKQGFIEELAIKGAEDLDERNARLREIAVRFGDQAYFLDSTEWTKNISVLNAAVEWLGFHQSCFFRELLELNTRGTGYDHGRTELKADPNCRYIG